MLLDYVGNPRQLDFLGGVGYGKEVLSSHVIVLPWNKTKQGVDFNGTSVSAVFTTEVNPTCVRSLILQLRWWGWDGARNSQFIKHRVSHLSLNSITTLTYLQLRNILKFGDRCGGTVYCAEVEQPLPDHTGPITPFHREWKIIIRFSQITLKPRLLP